MFSTERRNHIEWDVLLGEHLRLTVSGQGIDVVRVFDIHERPEVPGIPVIMSPRKSELSVWVSGTNDGLQLLRGLFDLPTSIARSCVLLVPLDHGLYESLSSLQRA